MVKKIFYVIIIISLLISLIPCYAYAVKDNEDSPPLRVMTIPPLIKSGEGGFFDKVCREGILGISLNFSALISKMSFFIVSI